MFVYFQLFEIDSTKPVLVHLAFIELSSGLWNTTFILPPTSQYMKRHVFPDLADFSYNVISYATIISSYTTFYYIDTICLKLPLRSQ